MQARRPFLALAAFAGAALCAALAPSAPSAPASASQSATARRDGSTTRVELAGGALVHLTESSVDGLRVLAVPGSSALVVLWSETDAAGARTPWYAIIPDDSLDGRTAERARPTSYAIRMSQASFDPLAGAPDFARSPLQWDGEVHLVQFHTQVLHEYRAALEQLGARVHGHLVHHTLIARMSPAVRSQVEGLEVVRWVGPFHPELRLEPELAAALRAGTLAERGQYNVTVFERGLADQELAAGRITALGGAARALAPEGFRFEAELSPAQLAAVLGMAEVAGVDRWSPPEADMDIAREFSGANDLESQTGFSGEGVRGEVCDTGCDTAHPDLQHHGGVLLHGPNGTSLAHGTAMTGIVFGDGTGNPAARGVLPDGKAVFARLDELMSGAISRYVHTAELLDPSLPYQCVFQTNSWGHAHTTTYTSYSQELDDILFLHDILITHSQGNTSTNQSRPEAWAKNALSVGGIAHKNTLDPSDDQWTGASSGPASDGRVKPDMAHFYDEVFTLAAGGGYGAVAGTSASTAIVAGHFGLFFQMWHEDVWGNGPTGPTVFDSRPSARLARAALINTARQWAFSGSGHNLGRIHQGWGAPDVRKLYDTRGSTFSVDETDVIGNLGVRAYALEVEPGAAEIKATLVYRDPKGVLFAGVQRVNDLSLRVTAPGGAVYWGNAGLESSPWSAPGGAENHVDVVENVFVQAPAAGLWLVEVLGTDINTDLVPGVPGNNADFALWVTGVEDPCPTPEVYCTAKVTSAMTVPAIGYTGTPSQGGGQFDVTLAGAVPGKNGLVFWAPLQAGLPFQGGFLCVAGAIERGPLTVTSASGGASFAVAITPMMVGTTRHFQWWFRDPPAPFTTGLSDGLRATFCP